LVRHIAEEIHKEKPKKRDQNNKIRANLERNTVKDKLIHNRIGW
jgi:hypothetical protein